MYFGIFYVPQDVPLDILIPGKLYVSFSIPYKDGKTHRKQSPIGNKNPFTKNRFCIYNIVSGKGTLNKTKRHCMILSYCYCTV